MNGELIQKQDKFFQTIDNKINNKAKPTDKIHALVEKTSKTKKDLSQGPYER